MGTGKLTPKEEEGLGLAGEHDYAVLDMKEFEGQCLFLVKNPWSEGAVWKGNIQRDNSVVDVIAEEAKLSQGLRTTEVPKTSPIHTESLESGSFWMGLDDIFQSFESLYLNWNPGLFSHREDVHFKWNLAGSNSPDGSFVTNPQYEVRSSVGGTLWVLLSRHFTSKDDESEKDPNIIVDSESLGNGFISLYAFDSNGGRVFSSDCPAVHSPYVDSPNTLLKLEVVPRRASTVVVSGQGLPPSVNTFTLSAFSRKPLSLTEAQDEYTHTVLLRGVWTAATAGGNASSSSYHTNPQFSLHLAENSKVAILLEDHSQCYLVHIKLVWANGKQIFSIKTRDIVGDSGEYRKGYAFAELQDVQAGVYTIICSTFEQGQLGKFTLRISCMSTCVVHQIPVVMAGRFVTRLQPASVVPRSGYLSAPLTCHRLSRISICARSRAEDSKCKRITGAFSQLSIYNGRPPSKEIVAISRAGESLDDQGGLWIRDVDIEPRLCEGSGFWLVVERVECSLLQMTEYVDVEIFSDFPIKVGDWI